MSDISFAKKVYLIGVNHEVQFRRKSAETTKFVTYLREQIKKYNPDLLVEECSREALKLSRVASTTVQDIARSNSIKHLFCDPEPEERRKLGIPSRVEIKHRLKINGPVSFDSTEDRRIREEQSKYHPVREQFWVERLEEETFETALFVCGSDHLKSFSSLLEKHRYDVLTLD